LNEFSKKVDGQLAKIGAEFEVNKYITLRLEHVEKRIIEDDLGPPIEIKEHWETVIYLNGKRFNQCKFLMLNIPVDDIKSLGEIESIDEAAERLDASLEDFNWDGQPQGLIPPEVEFWAHCSNMQVWYENDYDTRLIHSNLAFPLLKRLTELGDPVARRVFKEEIVKRYMSCYPSVVSFLKSGGYLDYLSGEEFASMIEDIKSRDMGMEYVTYGNRWLEFVLNNRLNLSNRGIKDITDIDGLENLIELQSLNLNDNQISEIKGLEKLVNLKFLDLRNNLISDIKGLETLTNLYALWLSNNQIFEIKGLEKLTNLQFLNISNNQIIDIKGLEMLKKLKELKIHKNYIQEINGLDSLENLEELNLSSNQITEIKGLENLRNLKILWLDDNKIAEVKGLENLINLTDLILFKNPIIKIRGLKNLKKLTTLELPNNIEF